MSRIFEAVKKAGGLLKAWLGLPYVPFGILILLAAALFEQHPNMILTSALMLAFPLSWLCRLQCQREQNFYKRLILNGKNYRQASAKKTSPISGETCPTCKKTISPESNFCQYCGANLKRTRNST